MAEMTEKDNSPCLLVTTLTKVTEQFLSSLNQLKSDMNDPRMYEQQLVSVMEHYDRLDMVMKVLKIANPSLTLPTTQTSPIDTATHIMNTVTPNNWTQVVQGIQPQPELQNTVVPNSQVVQPVFKPDSSEVSNTQVSAAHVPQQQQQQQQIDQALVQKEIQRQIQEQLRQKLLEQKKQKEQQQEQQQRQQQLVLKSQQKQQQLQEQKKQQREQELGTKNKASTLFLDQFEKTAKDFAAQHNMEMKQVWESLFVYALPGNKLGWAKDTILDKQLDWTTARQLYLKKYPDVVTPPPPAVAVVSSRNLSVPDACKTSEYTFTTQPQPSYESSSGERMAHTRERQSRYAEFLLKIEMKEYESISDFNAKYYRYAKSASMNLNDPSLCRRYVSSLLPNYRSLVTQALQQAPNMKSLKEVMHVASNTVRPMENGGKVNGTSCWKHRDAMKRNVLDEPSRQAKKFCA